MTVRVTKTSTHLEQIHHIGIVNRGPVDLAGDDQHCYYDVHLDGEPVDQITHYRADGALSLLWLALDYMRVDGRLKPEKGSEGG